VRHLQRQLLSETDRAVALDAILTDPTLAGRFDALAARIRPGFEPVAYRWAALALRKSGSNKLSPQFVLPADREVGFFSWTWTRCPPARASTPSAPPARCST
jgi:hypothetical protein